MNIEPLKSILEWSPDKKDTLLYYLPYEVKKKVFRLDLEEESLYVQDRVQCVRRDTFEIEHGGTVLFIENEKIGLKITSMKTVTINPNEYYIFVRNKKSISKKREFMKQLLEQI